MSSTTVRPRRPWIGGSTVPAIMGVSPYTTPLVAYQQILGEAPMESPEQLSFFRRRKSFEPVAAEIFREQTGLKIVRRNRRYTDPAHRFLRAEIDCETEDDSNVEIKTVHPLAAQDWGRGSDDTADDDAAPIYVVAQAMHGLGITNRKRARVLAMIGFDDARIYLIERDEAVIEQMRTQAITFWQQHVKPRVPPPPVNAADLRLLFQRDRGTVLDATGNEEINEAYRAYLESREVVKAAERVMDREAEKLQLFMGDAAAIRIGRGEVVTWRAHDRRDLDRSALKAAHPALIEQFQRTQAVRVFRVK